MKNLKSYKLFENSQDNIIDEVMDMSIDLIDSGFDVINTVKNLIAIRKYIDGKTVEFHYEEIKPFVERAKKYLNDEGYIINIECLKKSLLSYNIGASAEFVGHMNDVVANEKSELFRIKIIKTNKG